MDKYKIMKEIDKLSDKDQEEIKEWLYDKIMNKSLADFRKAISRIR
jgi:predicted house-cleaning noncanonical NTP pyrophosphatase (MazG superfamily)